MVVIGGGDTGSDCVGTSNRHGALSVTQLELMPMPPEQENKPLVWPYWPLKLRTSSSHQEGCEREFAIGTKEFIGERANSTAVKTVRLAVQGRQDDGSARLRADPQGRPGVPGHGLCLARADRAGCRLAWTRIARGNAKASTDLVGGYATNVPKLFAAGDIRRGQSLVVWAIREGRQAARAVDEFLMGATTLPR